MSKRVQKRNKRATGNSKKLGTAAPIKKKNLEAVSTCISVAIFVAEYGPVQKGIAQSLRSVMPKYGEYTYLFDDFVTSSADDSVLDAYAEEILKGGYKAVVTIGLVTTLAIKRVASRMGVPVPIIFNAIQDPVDLGIVHSYEESRNNCVGSTAVVASYVLPAQLMLKLNPQITSYFLPYHQNAISAHQELEFKDAQKEFRRCGISLKLYPFKDDKIESELLAEMQKYQALIIAEASMRFQLSKAIIGVARAKNLEVFCGSEDALEIGALIGVKADLTVAGRITAEHLYAIFEKDKRPTDLKTKVVKFGRRGVINAERLNKKGVSFNPELFYAIDLLMARNKKMTDEEMDLFSCIISGDTTAATASLRQVFINDLEQEIIDGGGDLPAMPSHPELTQTEKISITKQVRTAVKHSTSCSFLYPLGRIATRKTIAYLSKNEEYRPIRSKQFFYNESEIEGISKGLPPGMVHNAQAFEVVRPQRYLEHIKPNMERVDIATFYSDLSRYEQPIFFEQYAQDIEIEGKKLSIRQAEMLSEMTIDEITADMRSHRNKRQVYIFSQYFLSQRAIAELVPEALALGLFFFCDAPYYKHRVPISAFLARDLSMYTKEKDIGVENVSLSLVSQEAFLFARNVHMIEEISGTRIRDLPRGVDIIDLQEDVNR